MYPLIIVVLNASLCLWSCCDARTLWPKSILRNDMLTNAWLVDITVPAKRIMQKYHFKSRVYLRYGHTFLKNKAFSMKKHYKMTVWVKESYQVYWKEAAWWIP